MHKLAVLIIAVGILVFDSKTYAQISRLKVQTEKVNTAQKSNGKRRFNEFDLLKRIQQGNDRIEQILQRRSSVPTIWEKSRRILTGQVFRGLVLNSIVSTNVSSPVLVEILPNQGIPNKTRLSCEAISQNKRVFTLCNKMISKDKESPVVVQILNLDGTSGLIGEIDEGNSEVIAGNVLSESSHGILNGLGGSIGTASSSNALVTGLIESGKSGTDLLTADLKKTEPIITIDAGEEVLIYFMEAVNDA